MPRLEFDSVKNARIFGSTAFLSTGGCDEALALRAMLDGTRAPVLLTARALFSQFAEPRMLSRGRAWLDASDHRLRRLVTEGVVSDKTLPEPGVAGRSEFS
jgi:hypothetical protein